MQTDGGTNNSNSFFGNNTGDSPGENLTNLSDNKTVIKKSLFRVILEWWCRPFYSYVLRVKVEWDDTESVAQYSVIIFLLIFVGIPSIVLTTALLLKMLMSLL